MATVDGFAASLGAAVVQHHVMWPMNDLAFGLSLVEDSAVQTAVRSMMRRQS